MTDLVGTDGREPTECDTCGKLSDDCYRCEHCGKDLTGQANEGGGRL